MNEREQEWGRLLREAITEPGTISAAYNAFYGYSLGNQILALSQCSERGLTPGPISTYGGWKTKGRQVQKGQTAIELWMPFKGKKQFIDDEGEETFEHFTYFKKRSNWFVASQTEGDPIPSVTIPEWDGELAISELGIVLEEFDHIDGNCQGYASNRTIAINPAAQLPMKTMFHELAHVLLGHTDKDTVLTDGERLNRSTREVEAESVAMICCEALDLPGVEYSRGYIQGWLKTDGQTPEDMSRRIFSAANKILKAGQVPAAKGNRQ